MLSVAHSTIVSVPVPSKGAYVTPIAQHRSSKFGEIVAHKEVTDNVAYIYATFTLEAFTCRYCAHLAHALVYFNVSKPNINRSTGYRIPKPYKNEEQKALYAM